MLTRTALLTSLVAAGLIAVGGTASAAEAGKKTVIVDSGEPGGAFGYWGLDIYTEQSVAARFTVPADGNYELRRVGVWLMNNSDSERGRVKLSVQTDALDEGGLETLPSGVTLDKWTTRVDTFGWSPVQQFAKSKSHPTLMAGRSYWVVAASQTLAGVDPVWTFAAEGTMVTTTTFNGAWQTAGEGAALTLRVDAVKVAEKLH